MSKKAQKNQPQKRQTEIVDQQKDPMLRALQKKVRNINKKLTEITQLSTRKDLKPEQEQKISKKGQVVQQKEKYLEMIEVYKEIAAESQKAIRKTQLAELEDLAAAIAAKEYLVDLGFLFNQNVDNLVRVLTTPTSNNLTLKQRIDQISESLTFAANNLKLKKSLKAFIQDNQDLKRQAPVVDQTVSEPTKAEPQKQVQVKKPEKEQKQAPCVAVTQVVEQPKIQKPVQAEVAPVVVAEAPKIQQVEEKVAQTPIPESKPTQAANTQGEQTKTQEQNAPKEEGKGGEKRGYRGYRGRGSRGGDRNGEKPQHDGQRPQKKRNFKPKYENQEQKRRDSSSSQSSNSEPKARQFKREQVRQLIEDGFIVVGKPKVKARDQKQFHDHQHGNKRHHQNHTKKNY